MAALTFPQFLQAFNGLYKESDRLYYRLARHYGLSECAFWILYILRGQNRPLTQTELCDALSLSKQTINSALKGLEADGYLRLEIPPHNHRNREIRLTPSGLSLMEKTIDPVFQMEQEAFQSLNEQEQSGLLSLMQKHLSALYKASEQILKKP